ncbi:hypothetical protein SAZ10_02400 [Mesorhizobium sp. BAC0120]|uniref:hypothetical protein n=1 Tax=Mesorhizobium sp. BAC0120 TaxID=3090670 RepID=UPI00298CA221|nr:hypothetical protein [Mesorhizobium sp. BAC0120]MDW6020608.1 hypothetical protein [Mesorhizobium sp. BAC0120]
MSSFDELGQRALERLAEIWEVDGEVRWIKGGKGEAPGFNWWPGDFRVCARVQQAAEAAADSELRIMVVTDFLKNAPIESDRFMKFVAMTAPVATSTYGWVYVPVESPGPTPTVSGLRFSSSAYFTRDTIGWMPELLAETAVIQPINAQLHASMMAELLGGEPNTSRPAHLRDIEFNGVLGVVGDIYAPSGKGPSRWSGTDEFEIFAEKWGQSDYCVSMGNRTRLSLATSFGNNFAMIHLLTEAKHLQLGHGLMATLELPYGDTLPAIAKEAAVLNLYETLSWTGFPQLGCWHATESRTDETVLAFTLFMPNALYRPGLATNIAWWFLRRARWVREERYPDVQDLPLTDIPERLSAVPREETD